ncbi:MAG: hypothetical protein AAGF11_40560 [Myxococcota bacterium]
MRPVGPWLSRLLLGGGVGVAAAVGACALPTDYPMSLGYGLEVRLEAATWSEADERALEQRVHALSGVERVELHVSERVEQRIDDDGRSSTAHQIQILLFVFGNAPDSEWVWSTLQHDVPALVDAQVYDVPLEGTVEGTLGGRLSHRFFDLTLDQQGVEQAERRLRAELVAELVAEGLAPQDATIDIEQSTDAAGRRRIEVRVQAER